VSEATKNFITSLSQRFEKTHTSSEYFKCSKCGEEEHKNFYRDNKSLCRICIDKISAKRNSISPRLHARKIVKNNMEMAQIPPRFLPANYGNFKTDIKIPVCHYSVKENVLIWGETPGAGKTHLGVSILRRATWHGIKCRFVSAINLFIHLKSSFKENSEISEESIIDNYSEHPILMIDDIGTEKISEYVLQSWYAIIDNRYSNMLPTIFTSNYNLNQISDKLGARLASRIGSGIVINLKGNDRRVSRK